MKRLIFSLLLLSGCVLSGTEREILVCTAKDAPASIRAAAATLNDARPLAALRQCGAASGDIRMTESAPLLEAKNFRLAAFNNLILVGLPENDPLLTKCLGHQASIKPGRFYRLGYGALEGDLGYVECDWNPFLFSDKVRTNPYTTVCIKITGTSEKGLLAAVEAFKNGLLNGVVPAGEVRRTEESLLDLTPSPATPPALPETIAAGNFHATQAGWTQPDAKEYRAFLDIGGKEPKQIWRVKYLADKALEGVSGEEWVNGLHRLAYGNTVMIAEFTSPSDAEAELAGFARQRDARTITLNGHKTIVFDQPTDEAFPKPYGKIYYTTTSSKIIVSSLPREATLSILSLL